MAGGRYSKKRLELADREAKAIELRKLGLSYRAIAKQVREEFGLDSYNESMCFQDVDRVYKRIRAETRLSADEMRTQEAERYDLYLTRLSKGIMNGDVKAINSAISISESRRRMEGLDEAVQVKIEQGVVAELSGFLEAIKPHLPGDTYEQVLNAIAISCRRERAV